MSTEQIKEINLQPLRVKQVGGAMNKNKLTILVVDDNEVNRKILRRLLLEEYEVVEAENGKQALEILSSFSNEISAILLDLVMPIMGGYTFLSDLKKTENYGIPVIVTTGSAEKDNEKKAFSLGAWDFVSKPYDAQILKYRLQSAIAKSESAAFEQMKYMAEHDSLTGLYNRGKFFKETERMLKLNPQTSFAFVSFDVDRFSLVNTFFGNIEGDKLLKTITEKIIEIAGELHNTTYGRIEADKFAFCCECSDISKLKSLLDSSCNTFGDYPLDFQIVLSFGIYKVTDRSISARQMLDYANLAVKRAKGHYSNNVAIYDEGMGRQLIAQQEIINQMNQALEEEQFCIYIQPKYDLNTNLPVGGEVLVRWNHPEKGMIPPGDFISVFEKNGFIAKLDYYVWEKACVFLNETVDNNLPMFPISVNVSRVHLYNPQLVELLSQMLDKYDIPHEYLNLELTESIYTENPSIIQQSISKLHNAGFVVMMDDFGSGYSSLNVLKDVEFDVLKIDMRFFEKSNIEGRGENIINSIIRMAKWLGIPTIAEGVENKKQAMFLRDIGCEYVQGYYFAKPMPKEEYKSLLFSNETQTVKRESYFSPSDFWKETSLNNLLFSTIPQPIALYEFYNEKIELIRVNNAFNETFGYNDIVANSRTPEKVLPPEYVSVVWDAFHQAIRSKDTGECDYLRICLDGKERWMHIHLKYVNEVAGKHIILGTLWDITSQVKINNELRRYKKMLGSDTNNQRKMLIIDDIEVNREILKQMFDDKFAILQAVDGQQAMEVLQNHQYAVDIILLDLIMPVMDGVTFLQHKKENPLMSDIPVVIITTDADPVKQVDMLELGANDYIAKPFVKEVAIKRVANVLESSSRFLEIVKKYNHVLELSKKDSLTCTYNRTETENLINQHLISRPDLIHGFLMLDIDNFKMINDTYGHITGDVILKEIAEKLQDFFRSTDIIGRLGGDEFIIFMPGVQSERHVLNKAQELCKALSQNELTNQQIRISATIGVCVSDKDSSFADLYSKADKVLYEAKLAGKMQARTYQNSKQEVHS